MIDNSENNSSVTDNLEFISEPVGVTSRRVLLSLLSLALLIPVLAFSGVFVGGKIAEHNNNFKVFEASQPFIPYKDSSNIQSYPLEVIPIASWVPNVGKYKLFATLPEHRIPEQQGMQSQTFLSDATTDELIETFRSTLESDGWILSRTANTVMGDDAGWVPSKTFGAIKPDAEMNFTLTDTPSNGVFVEGIKSNFYVWIDNSEQRESKIAGYNGFGD
jgi:hypothetical protein